ncbi:hypothetical protein NKG94_35785 [Micromonospora sp. M12]
MPELVSCGHFVTHHNSMIDEAVRAVRLYRRRARSGYRRWRRSLEPSIFGRWLCQGWSTRRGGSLCSARVARRSWCPAVVPR